MKIDLSTEAGLDVRIPPLAAGALGPLGRSASWVAGRVTHGEPPHVLTTLARHRKLLRRWLPFATGLLRGTDLPTADVELVILRTAVNCASWYEWAQHVTLAGRADLAPEACARVVEGPLAEGWSDRHRALLLGTDELHESRVICDATWELLAAELDDHELLELCFVVGHYEMLAMALNSLGVEPEPSALSRLDDAASQTARALRTSLVHRRGPKAVGPRHSA